MTFWVVVYSGNEVEGLSECEDDRREQLDGGVCGGACGVMEMWRCYWWIAVSGYSQIQIPIYIVLTTFISTPLILPCYI